MSRARSRGFTLVETMVAFTIGFIVLAQLAVILGSSTRLINEVLTVSELMINTRRVRDKIVFNLTPRTAISYWEYAGTVHGTIIRESPGGIMNGYDLHADNVGITMNLTNIETAATSPNNASVRLRLFLDNGNFYIDGLAYVTLDGVLQPNPWVKPGAQTFTDPTRVIDFSELSSKNRLFINLDYQLNGIRRAERVCFPVFGRIQPSEELTGLTTP